MLQRGWRRGQPGLCPDDHIVSQAAQKHDHLLGFKSLFAVLADEESLFVAFERGFDRATALVVQTHMRQQDLRGI